MSERKQNGERGRYAVLAVVYGGAVGSLLLRAERRGRLRPTPSPLEIVVLGVATHKLTRLISRERVTSFLRAPFTEYEEPSQLSEVNERPRGQGMRYAIGQLLTCPFCLGLWVAGGFTVGAVYVPGPTIAAASVLGSLTVSDFLHIAYVRAARSVE